MAFIKPLGYDPVKCAKLMEDMGLAGMVVTSNENVFYTTGLPVTRGQVNPILFALSNQFPSYSVLHPDGMPTMVAWTGALGGHEFWVKDVRSAWMRGGTTEELIDSYRSSFKQGQRVGVESSAPHALLEKLKKIVDVEFVDADSVFDKMRSVKSKEEVAMMTRSLEITEKAVKVLQEEITRETTGHQLISRAKALIFEFGGSGVDHTTMAIGHSNPEIPEDVRSKEGDLIVLDLGTILHGYCSDNRRLAIIGELPDELEKAHSDMVDVVVDTGMSARAGMGFGEICKNAEGSYREKGREPMFISVGHTIGLQTEELWISRDSEWKFEEGMVFNVELYTRTESGSFVGTEDTFVVESGKSRQLSGLPHDIKVVA